MVREDGNVCDDREALGSVDHRIWLGLLLGVPKYGVSL